MTLRHEPHNETGADHTSESATSETPTVWYIVGSNTPGYLPESETYTTSDYDSARRYLIHELDRHADILSDIGLDDAAEEISLRLGDLDLDPAGTLYWELCPTSGGEHDLGVAYWLEISYEAPEGLEDAQ